MPWHASSDHDCPSCSTTSRPSCEDQNPRLPRLPAADACRRLDTLQTPASPTEAHDPDGGPSALPASHAMTHVPYPPRAFYVLVRLDRTQYLYYVLRARRIIRSTQLKLLRDAHCYYVHVPGPRLPPDLALHPVPSQPSTLVHPWHLPVTDCPATAVAREQY